MEPVEKAPSGMNFYLHAFKKKGMSLAFFLLLLFSAQGQTKDSANWGWYLEIAPGFSVPYITFPSFVSGKQVEPVFNRQSRVEGPLIYSFGLNRQEGLEISNLTFEYTSEAYGLTSEYELPLNPQIVLYLSSGTRTPLDQNLIIVPLIDKTKIFVIGNIQIFLNAAKTIILKVEYKYQSTLQENREING